MKPLLFLSTAFLLCASVRAQPEVAPIPVPARNPYLGLRNWPQPELSPIEKAIREDDAPKVLELIKIDPKLRVRSQFDEGMSLGQSPTQFAIQWNSLKVVRALLDNGTDANVGFLLGLALRKQGDEWKPLAQLLVEKGARINARTDNGESQLLSLLDVPFQTRQKWIFLMTHGADVMQSANWSALPDGRSIIEVAFNTKKQDALFAMLAYLPVNTRVRAKQYRQEGRQTLLHLALQAQNDAAFEQLLARGADPNALDGQGKTPLDYATNRIDGKMERLLRAGAKPDENTLQNALRALDTWRGPIPGEVEDPTIPKPDRTPANWLAPLVRGLKLSPKPPSSYSSLALALRTRDHDLLQMVRDASPPRNDTARFFLAASVGDVNTLRLLARKSPLLTFFRLPNGETPLHFAALWGELDAMRFLVTAGADINGVDSQGQTPLHYAIRNPTPARALRVERVVAFLKLKGANFNANRAEDTVLWTAIRSHDIKLARQLLDCGADPNGAMHDDAPVLILAGRLIDGRYERSWGLPMLRLLLERGAHPDARSEFQATPMMLAIWREKVDFPVARLLLQFGADINTHSRSGRTALSALFSDYADIRKETPARVKFAIEHGADPNLPTHGGTLLDAAVSSWAHIKIHHIQGLEASSDWWLEATRELLRSRKVSFRPAIRNWPVLAVATDAPTTEMVALLLEYGADPNEKCAWGQTTLEWARGRKRPDAVALMEAKINAPTKPALVPGVNFGVTNRLPAPNDLAPKYVRIGPNVKF